MSSASRSPRRLNPLVPGSSLGMQPPGASLAPWYDAAPTSDSWVEVLPSGVAAPGGQAALIASRRAAEQAALLAMGLEQLDRQEWAAADETLRRARDLRIDDAEVLAALALARVHNPAIAERARLQEALNLIEVAGLLDPDHAGVQSAALRVRARVGEASRDRRT